VCSQKRKPRLTPLKDGPYKVEELEKLTDSRGRPIPVNKTFLLCRCGGSGSKPFCDGTHVRIGFSSDGPVEQTSGKKPPADRRRSYQGAHLTIHDNRRICSHAEHCTRCSPQVFRRDKVPWIDPDGEEPGKVIKTINMCPSGSLSYSVDGVEYRDHEAEAEIHVDRNGPYCVRGGIVLVGHSLGRGASLEHYTLCRCGRSRNMPLCDGSHHQAGFSDGSPPDSDETCGRE
jgi:CDGSH-type Zn-finger protein